MKPLQRMWALILTVAVASCFTFAGQALAQEPTWSEVMEKQVKTWIQHLSQTDKQFAAWKDATWQIQTLGPQSHQWLVTLKKQGKDVGYLIVGEKQGGSSTQKESFVLLEYGWGEFVLFDDSFAPRHTAAEPVYDGFGSYWLVSETSPGYIDAKTGEKYPSVLEPNEPVFTSLPLDGLVQPGLEITSMKQFSSPSPRPFDDINWLRAKQAVPEKQNDPISWVNALLDKSIHQFVVTASLFQGKVFAPFSVGALHVWGEHTAYLGVWDEGMRYLPVSYVQQVGTLLAVHK